MTPTSARLATGSPPTIPRCISVTAGAIKSWTGPIHVAASATGAHANEKGTGDGTVELAEDTDGNLSGTVHVHGSTGCPLPAQKNFDLKVVGKIADAKLTISAVPGEVVKTSMEDALCGFPDGFLGDEGEKGSPITPMVVPLITSSEAKGSGTIIDDESPQTPYHVRIQFTYTRDLTLR